MNCAREKVLLTGATGFVGGNLAAKLIELGAEVVSVERNKASDSLTALKVGPRVNTVIGDITDLAFMRHVFADYHVTFAFHLAAQAEVGVALQAPLETFETNIRGTWTILEAARTTPTLKGLVVASSDKAYGIHATLPCTEEFPLLGRFPYDASKACADVLTQSYYVTYGAPVAVIRCANTYGPGDRNLSRLIPAAIRCGLANEPLELRSNGMARREFLYVEDAVDAYLALARALIHGEMRGECVNCGTGATYTVLEVANLVRRLTGSTAEPRVHYLAGKESPKQWLDSTKAATRLGWTARTPLEQGLTRSIAWYRDALGSLTEAAEGQRLLHSRVDSHRR